MPLGSTWRLSAWSAQPGSRVQFSTTARAARGAEGGARRTTVRERVHRSVTSAYCASITLDLRPIDVDYSFLVIFITLGL